ncbi:hypothetical protein EC836_106211 [Erwinia sp. JUb26]|nr:hypothetical protein EC836_106211 [Erwinia sp. JUb26]
MTNERLSANEVDVVQFWLERVTLNSLHFNFDFFAICNQSQHFFVKTRLSLQVHYGVVVQFDSDSFFFATVNDSWEFVSYTQAAARTLTLLFTYIYIDSEHLKVSSVLVPATGDPAAGGLFSLCRAKAGGIIALFAAAGNVINSAQLISAAKTSLVIKDFFPNLPEMALFTGDNKIGMTQQRLEGNDILSGFPAQRHARRPLMRA